MINAKILLDSINPAGSRITTWILQYPRFIHAEVLTHRVFSRNASSSRAIPVKKMLDDAINNPAMPVFWGKNQSGMQAAEELDNVIKRPRNATFGSGAKNTTAFLGDLTDMEYAKFLWLEARDNAVKSVEAMQVVGLHKQIANRLLEPWMHITVIATATDHENFFSLRAHKDAQPEFQELAYLMLRLYQDNAPTKLAPTEWHIPFGDNLDRIRLKGIWEKLNSTQAIYTQTDVNDMLLKVATARCARVSYLNFEGKDDYEADIALSERLSQSGHWSPFEHCAMALGSDEQSGNFRGWKQYRKFFPMENRTDGRVERYKPVSGWKS